MLEYLVGRGEADKTRLIEFFRPMDGHPNPDVGRYTKHEANLWWKQVGAPQLSAIPGVEQDKDTWRFAGVVPGTFDDEYLVPLDELRDDPTVRLERALDDLGITKGSDEREELITVWNHLRSAGNATPDELDKTLRRVSLSNVEGALEELPSVERIEHQPPDPADIEVSTMADVIEGYETLETDTTVEWQYMGDNEPREGSVTTPCSRRS